MPLDNVVRAVHQRERIQIRQGPIQIFFRPSAHEDLLAGAGCLEVARFTAVSWLSLWACAHWEKKRGRGPGSVPLMD